VRVETRAALARALEDAVARRGMFSLIEVMLPHGAISDTLARFVRGFTELRARPER
jgi:indolepyruvate decarboxylase